MGSRSSFTTAEVTHPGVATSGTADIDAGGGGDQEAAGA